jgi:hypothetical protein
MSRVGSGESSADIVCLRAHYNTTHTAAEREAARRGQRSALLGDQQWHAASRASSPRADVTAKRFNSEAQGRRLGGAPWGVIQNVFVTP